MSGGEPDAGPAFRLDLDDLGGELCVLDWGGAGGGPASVPGPEDGHEGGSSRTEPVVLMQGRLSVTLVRESLQLGLGTTAQFRRRLVPLEGEKLRPTDRFGQDGVPVDLRE